MRILTLSEADKLKNTVKSKFNTGIHFHDCCGGQSFSLDEANPRTAEFIKAYLAEIGLCAVFSKNGLHFTIKEIN
ncbi:MAG: hypothetical protein ACI4DY_06775 [Monoglobaceae bacterium]